VARRRDHDLAIRGKGNHRGLPLPVVGFGVVAMGEVSLCAS
jgi:hypothetical protein